jgi:hypothetical protein
LDTASKLLNYKRSKNTSFSQVSLRYFLNVIPQNIFRKKTAFLCSQKGSTNASILKKRWMPNLRQQTPFVSANEKAPSHGAGLTKQIYK